MGKKDKRIAELEAEVARLGAAHDASVKALAESKSTNATLSAECDDLKATIKRVSKDAADRKRELAERENRIQELEQSVASSSDEIKQLKTKVEVAEQAARESAEQAEAAAATATAAAAAAAAMAGMSDDEDSDGNGGGNAGESMADRMAEAEATRETHAAQLDAVREISAKLREELANEKQLRESAEKRCEALEEQQGLKAVSQKLREAEEAAHKSSKLLVDQGEKNLKLHDKLQEARKKVGDAKQDIATVRRALVAEIAGEDAEFELYENISFPDLVRLALQGKRNGVSGGKAETQEGKDAGEIGSSRAAVKALKLDNSKLDGIRKAEAEIKAMRSALQTAQRQLQQHQKIAAKAESAELLLQELKDKNMELGNRIAREKDRVMGQKDEVRRRDDRIQALSDHIEKLMVHLKHEAAAKAKAVEGQKRAGRETTLLKQRNAALTQKNRAREKVIRELKEGCRILEDQLRLMDTKYVELRNKLDWTRSQSQKEVKRIQSEANKLRVKWMMVAGSDATLNALGIGDEGSGVQPDVLPGPAPRARTTGGMSNSSIRGKKRLPAVGGAEKQKRQLLAFQVPDIQDAEAERIDPDAPWADNKLNELQSSIKSTK